MKYTVHFPDGTCFSTAIAESEEDAIAMAWSVLVCEAFSLRKQLRFPPDTKFKVTKEVVDACM